MSTNKTIYVLNKNDIFKSSCLFLAISVILFSISSIDYLYALKANEYTGTKGEITKLYWEKGWRGGSYLVLEYCYSVNGKQYINNKFSNGLGDIKEFEKEYKNSNIFTIYYNHKNPKESVLVKGGRSSFVDGMIIISIFLLTISLLGFFSIKSKILYSFVESMFG